MVDSRYVPRVMSGQYDISSRILSEALRRNPKRTLAEWNADPMLAAEVELAIYTSTQYELENGHDVPAYEDAHYPGAYPLDVPAEIARLSAIRSEISGYTQGSTERYLGVVRADALPAYEGVKKTWLQMARGEQGEMTQEDDLTFDAVVTGIHSQGSIDIDEKRVQPTEGSALDDPELGSSIPEATSTKAFSSGRPSVPGGGLISRASRQGLQDRLADLNVGPSATELSQAQQTPRIEVSEADTRRALAIKKEIQARHARGESAPADTSSPEGPSL